MENKKTDTLISSADQEAKEASRYDQIADSFIESAKNLNPTQRLIMMRELLDDIEVATLSGEIKSSKGEPYAVEDIRGNLAKLSEELNLSDDKREYEDPLTLVPRAEGMRSAFDRLLNDKNTAPALANALAERASSSPETENRSKTRLFIGERAVDSTGINPPEDIVESMVEFNDPETESKEDEINSVYAEMNDLVKGLSSEDQRALHLYAVGMYADKEHEWGNALGRLSDSVKSSSLHTKYLDLFTRIQKLRKS